jgi:hypothetical protein
LTDLLSLGGLESMALPGESYKLAFTPGLLSSIHQRKRDNQPPENLLPNPASILGGPGSDRGGYVDLDGNGRWWIPSGRQFYSPNAGDTPVQELAFARLHFFLLHRFRDPFNNTVTVAYDSDDTNPTKNHNLLMVETRDSLGSSMRAEHDYRVLQSELVTDSNNNRSAVAFDVLGIVVGTAVMGKENGQIEGDSLNDFETDLDDQVIIAHMSNPFVNPQEILRKASTRLVYDLFSYQRTNEQGDPQPNAVYTLAREKHDADLKQGELTNTDLRSKRHF